MHTALVSRILRDKTMWEEVTVSEHETPIHSEAGAEATAGSSI